MRVTVLMENCTSTSRLAARHGLSLFLEAAGRRVLFDMGPDEAFLANARALGVDVASAELAVLSHGHYDHGGGLRAYLDATADSNVPVYVRKHAFDWHASGTATAHHAIGIDPALADEPRVVTVGEPRRELGRGLTLFSVTERPHAAAASNVRLLERRGGELVPDRFLHEQCLLVREGERAFLVSGCSHVGILNVIEEAERLVGGPLDAVVAGFHLMSPSGGTTEDPAATRALARELARRPTRYCTFHCTGLDAFGILRDELGERVRYLCAGSRAEL